MAIPALYNWLAPIEGKPKMIIEGIKLLGIKEYPGKVSNNPQIMKMATGLSIPLSVYPNDETAWCALVQSWLCKETGKPLPPGTVYDLLRAKSFLQWGVNAPIPMFGDIMIFSRPEGFHVGLYIAEDITHYHIMGGNQGNSYSIVRIEKKRLKGSRRFYSVAPPACVKQIIVAPNGVISNNEA